MQLNHLHIKTTDVAATRAFYEKYFGFRLLTATDGGTCFILDDANFMLTLVPYKDGDARIPDWFHLGFCQGDEQTVRDLYARMRADGVQFASELNVYDDDGIAFYCLDPGGNKVEVCCYKEEAHLYQKPTTTSART